MFKFLLVALIINVLLFSGCEFTGPLEFENPQIIRVMMRNSSQGPFSVNERPSTPVGGLDFVRAHFSDSPNEPNYSFDINRQSKPISRVSYKVLRFPAPSDTLGDLTIVVTEPSAGIFNASTPDITWLQIVSVQGL